MRKVLLIILIFLSISSFAQVTQLTNGQPGYIPNYLIIEGSLYWKTSDGYTNLGDTALMKKDSTDWYYTPRQIDSVLGTIPTAFDSLDFETTNGYLRWYRASAIDSTLLDGRYSLSSSPSAAGSTHNLQINRSSVLYGTDSLYFDGERFYVKNDTIDLDGVLKVSGGIIGESTITAPGNDNEIIINDGGNFGTSPQLEYIASTNSFTAGYRIGTVGINSVIIGGDSGKENTASGNASTAWGNGTGASGSLSTAWGNGTGASGGLSTAWGYFTDAGGNYSTAWGYTTDAGGNYSTAWGYSTGASGNTSTAWGDFTDASGSLSTAWGYFTDASGNYSTAWGYTTESHDYNETALGRYNIIGTGSSTSWVETDNLFTIGNGTSSIFRNNAFQIKKNGNTYIDGELEVAGDTTKVNHLKVDSNLYVNGRSILEKYEVAAFTDPDSTITTSASTTWAYLGGGEGNKFTTIYNEGFTYDSDTLVFQQNEKDFRDSVEFRFDGTAESATSSVNKTVYYSLFVKSVGESDYSEVRWITSKTRTTTAGVYYPGPTCTAMPIWLKDGDKIQIRAKVGANTTTITSQGVKVYLREE